MDASFPRSEADWDTHELVLSATRGWFLALCAAPLDDGSGHYLGYYKITAQDPASYWEAASLVKGCTHLARPSPREALRDAEDLARVAVYNLPAPHTLRAARESRPLSVFELRELGASRGGRRA